MGAPPESGGTTGGQTGANNEPRDPMQGYSFTVEVTGAAGADPAHGYFKEFSGVSFEVNAIQYKTYNYQTGKPETVQVAGRQDPGSVTLKRGLTPTLRMFKWASLVTQGKLADARATVTVTLRNRVYEPAIKVTLTNAWPSKFTMGAFNVETSEAQVEELTLVYESLTVSDFADKGK